MAFQIGIGNFSGAITSSVYRAADQPRYILGRECCPTVAPMTVLMLDLREPFPDAVEIGFLCMGLITAPLTVLIYRRINASRDALERQGEYEKYSEDELSKLGDRAPNFRYVY